MAREREAEDVIRLGAVVRDREQGSVHICDRREAWKRTALLPGAA